MAKWIEENEQRLAFVLRCLVISLAIALLVWGAGGPVWAVVGFALCGYLLAGIPSG